jgi:hypothetical protein
MIWRWVQYAVLSIIWTFRLANWSGCFSNICTRVSLETKD